MHVCPYEVPIVRGIQRKSVLKHNTPQALHPRFCRQNFYLALGVGYFLVAVILAKVYCAQKKTKKANKKPTKNEYPWCTYLFYVIVEDTTYTRYIWLVTRNCISRRFVTAVNFGGRWWTAGSISFFCTSAGWRYSVFNIFFIFYRGMSGGERRFFSVGARSSVTCRIF